MCCQYIFMLKYKGKDFKEGEKYGLYNRRYVDLIQNQIQNGDDRR